MRTIDWADGKIRIIDQTRLPAEELILSLSTVEEIAEAISSLRVRGAPALRVAATETRTLLQGSRRSAEARA